MSDPPFQAAWKRARWLLGGIGFVVAAVTAARNAHAITASMTIIGVVLCAVAWISAEAVARRRRPEWRLPGTDRRGRLTSLSAQPRWFFLGIIIVLLLPRLIDILGNMPVFQPKTADLTVEDKRYPQ